MSAAGEFALRERVLELEAIDDAVGALGGGEPGLLVIEGAAGIGKTSLVAAVRERALRAGVGVVAARGSELERDFPFGVVRQLLEPVVFAADDEQLARWFSGAAELARPLFSLERVGVAGPEEELRFRRRHGLFWLIAKLAREGALVVMVDDAQWADEPSAGFVRYLVTRLEQLAVLLVIAGRSHTGVLSGLAVEPGSRVLRPAELSTAAVRDWVSEALGQESDEAFAAACRQATGGNPFMVSELLREVRTEGLAPRGDAVQRLRSVSPRGVTTSLLLRLAGLSPACEALARAAAVLGEADLPVTASLAGLDAESAMRAASQLTRAGVFDTGERSGFVHPLVRTVLYKDLPPAARLLEHAGAARVLHHAGARREHIAAQLVLAARVGEPWAAEALAGAAADAAARGAPEVAARFLERLLDETDQDQRFEVVLALGRVQALAGDAGALERLRAAARLARSPAQRVRGAVSLGRVLRYAGAGSEAVAVLEAAAAGLDDADSELAGLVQRELLATSTVSYNARRRLAARTRRWWQTVEQPPRSLFDRFLTAAQAVEAATAGRDASDVLDLAEAAVARDPGAAHLGRHVRLLAFYAFLLCDRFDRGDALLGDLAEIAATRGGAEMVAIVAAQRAFAAHRRGYLLAAEAEATDALQSVAELDSPPTFLLTASAALTWVAIERGETPHPLATRSRDDGDSLFGRQLNYARAVLHVAEGRLKQGIDELLAVGERELGIGWSGPSQFAWRSDAALALSALGREEQARHLADEELALARASRAPRALGIALRASASLSNAGRLDQLREAVSVLEHSGAELEHARTLVDLGAAMRRARQPTDARSPLQRGHELAIRCGASQLATRAHEELLAAGARPRRTALRGRAALTPSELRVAELATQSLRNRDIAQALFITEKTVERHLSHAYTKLGVSSRRDLPDALTAEA
jgi:DNA-binding NarL/FixJ family response regulator